MGRSSLSGTPWHYEGPYHRGHTKCAHWGKKNKKSFCKLNGGRCSGSQCPDYTIKSYNSGSDNQLKYTDPSYASREQNENYRNNISIKNMKSG